MSTSVERITRFGVKIKKLPHAPDKKLRKQIMERDNYTCQICQKHMPDEVGLQIDRIIPISKGGKTVASNLRVLCNKCNGSKGAKLEDNA